MRIDSLKKSILNMEHSEALALIISIRNRRRARTIAKKERKAKIPDVDKMSFESVSKDEAARLLEIIEGVLNDDKGSIEDSSNWPDYCT